MNDKVLDALVPSEEMREFLKGQKLDEETVAALIDGSLAPLKIKVNFAKGRRKHDYERALELLSMHPDDPDEQRFQLYILRYDPDMAGPDLRYIGFFAYYDDMKEDFFADRECVIHWFEEDCPFYFIAVRTVQIGEKKWNPTGAYIIFNGEPIWYRETAKSLLFLGSLGSLIDCFSSPREPLRLPVPFRVGDLLELDCSPFGPTIVALLVKAGEDPKVLYRIPKPTDDEHIWRVDSLAKCPYLNEADYYEEIQTPFSPYYRLKKFEGNLPKEAEPLMRAKDFIRGDEAKAIRLCDGIHRC